ncbi:hypothetical protein CFIMG_008028RA00001 [Ceratocystis fimbriata CBS 114723]|uniref:Uncharacterized protein n=1 Tax=Ceratocystis fimbriata CBS 114723 TaxID=1035309 RepID=A0A2C5WTS7_9PEZI|nr:hypothetical protein CFIMG_008028RA00001 [Ceratocystis fimbriata CBS 114723]
MFLFHLTSLCLSLLFFTAQPTQAAGKSVEFTIPTNSNPTSKQYLEEHGYSLCDINDSNSGFKTYSLYYGTSYSDTVQDLALHVGLNTERKVTTIFNNNLEHEAYREGYLELDEIFHSLCLSQNIDFNRMEWIVMDVYDRNVNAAIRHYRGNNHLTDKAQIRVTPKDMDWSTFSTMHYYETAAKMVPGKEIDRILVIQQERQIWAMSEPKRVEDAGHDRWPGVLTDFGSKPMNSGRAQV